ncbi:hypothetical protein GCM10027168_32680 [Streptomyces capparidis]
MSGVLRRTAGAAAAGPVRRPAGRERRWSRTPRPDTSPPVPPGGAPREDWPGGARRAEAPRGAPGVPHRPAARTAPRFEPSAPVPFRAATRDGAARAAAVAPPGPAQPVVGRYA